MTRIKKSTTQAITSKAEFEACVDTLSKLQLEHEKMVADYNAQKAAQDKAHKAKVKSDTAKMQDLIARCEAYADHHREELLGDRQTGKAKLGKYGYRKSPGVLTKLNSKWTVAKTIAALKSAGKLACVKVTESLNKAAIKNEIPEPDLPQFGLRMEYGEEFWVEAIRVTDAPEKRLTPAN